MTKRVAWWARALLAVALAALPAVIAGPSAVAAPKICVALVVDFGTLGGGVHSTCATVAKGSTGYDVLHAGGHTFAICSNGVLGSIDGRPADGCTEMKDNKHYWSYWHRAAGSTRWTYSNFGAGGYHPGNGTTEGWRWMDHPPANVPYDRICPKASRSPSPAAAPRSPTAPTSTTPKGSAAPSPTATSAAASRHQAGAQPTHRAGKTAPTAPRSSSPHSTAAATATGSPSPPPSPAPRAANVDASTHSSSVPPGLLIGLVVAVALAAGAGWQLHRRRSGE